MKNTVFILIGLLVPFFAFSQTTGSELIAASIKFHDPDAQWASTKATLHFVDTRPGKDDRTAILYLDNANSTVCIMREQEGKKVTRHIINDKCLYDVDGNASPSAAEIETLKLNNKRSLMLRNYYLYLWGLPMKLTDPGTQIDDRIYEKNFNGQTTRAVRVTYDQEVGSDIWYFYFDTASPEMVGYQFFHDEAKGDGEYIILSGLMEINGMKIPANRTWYTNPDSTLLGTDKLVSWEILNHSH